MRAAHEGYRMPVLRICRVCLTLRGCEFKTFCEGLGRQRFPSARRDTVRPRNKSSRRSSARKNCALDMKTLTIRLPDFLARQIEQESQARRVSKSDIVREPLAAGAPARQEHPLADILAEIDSQPVRGSKRNAARDKKRLPEIIRAHYRGAKRHYRQ